MYIYSNIYVYIHICLHEYIYTWRSWTRLSLMCLVDAFECVYLCTYIYIYMYTYIHTWRRSWTRLSVRCFMSACGSVCSSVKITMKSSCARNPESCIYAKRNSERERENQQGG